MCGSGMWTDRPACGESWSQTVQGFSVTCQEDPVRIMGSGDRLWPYKSHTCQPGRWSELQVRHGCIADPVWKNQSCFSVRVVWASVYCLAEGDKEQQGELKRSRW